MKLKISEKVMGNPYISREIQVLCKRGIDITPKEMVVLENGNGLPNAIIVFPHNGVQYELVLSLFHQPPGVENLMQVLPYEVKPAFRAPRSRRAWL